MLSELLVIVVVVVCMFGTLARNKKVAFVCLGLLIVIMLWSILTLTGVIR